MNDPETINHLALQKHLRNRRYKEADDGNMVLQLAAADRLDALEAERAALKAKETVWEAETAEARRQSADVVRLREERDALKALARSAEDDCQRAITCAEKAELDLKCLQESTVDSKAFEAANKRISDLEEALRECLREHGGYTIKGECERRARKALGDQS